MKEFAVYIEATNEIVILRSTYFSRDEMTFYEGLTVSGLSSFVFNLILRNYAVILGEL